MVFGEGAEDGVHILVCLWDFWSEVTAYDYGCSGRSSLVTILAQWIAFLVYARNTMG